MDFNAQADSTGAAKPKRSRRNILVFVATVLITFLGAGVYGVASAATSGVTQLDQPGISADGFTFDAGAFYKVEAVRVTRITNTDQGETHLFADWYAGLGWDESAYNAGPDGNEFAVNVFSGSSATGPWTSLGTFYFSKDTSTTSITSTTTSAPTKTPKVHPTHTKKPHPTKTR